MTQPSRPNLLILIADQLTPTALPVYGHRSTRAPQIAALAAQGVVFDAAYCASPLCAPSRYGLLTGRLPSNIGAYDNACELPSQVPTFAHHLRRIGYHTVLAGKMHFAGPNQLHGFEDRLTTDIYPADFGWTPDWTQPDVRPEWFHNMTSVTQAGPCVRTNQIDYDEEVVFKARRKLFDFARQGDGRPFCLTVSLTHPHDPYVIPQRYWDLYRDEDIDLPRVAADDVPADPHSQRIRRACLIDGTPVSAEQVRRARRAYYGAISFVDEQIGYLLEALEQTGRRNDTIIVVLSDHGDMLGERGLWYKMTHYEGAVRVPLIVNAPGRFAPARVAASVSTLDLLPTLLDIAEPGLSATLPTALEGRSLLPHLQGRGGHDQAIAEYLGEIALAPIVMIRRGDFKYIHSPACPDQLFDLRRDPDERHDLATLPAYQERLAALRAEVRARWNMQALEQQVIASQQQRRLVHEAECQGQRMAWDHQPREDASRQYVRSHMRLDDIEAMARYPAWKS